MVTALVNLAVKGASTLAKKAVKAAKVLSKQPSIMTGDTRKFAGKFGKDLAEHHLGKTRVDKAIKSVAKDAAKKKSKTKKPKSKKKWTKKDLAHMTKEERGEFSKLRKQQERDAKGSSSGGGSTAGGAREQMLIRQGRRASPHTGDAVPRGSRKPKVKYPRQKRSVVEDPSGRLKSKAQTFSDREKKFLEPYEQIEEQLRPMPPGTASQIYEGMRGKRIGQDQLDDLEDMIRSGEAGMSVVGRKHGGKIKSGRGVGKALRGWGKVSS
tara:strand:- start:102 stop:902 length:801 start_codon:yes stop_codon:yes gene_type:complete